MSYLKFLLDSVLKSYSQIFFSINPKFGLLILLITFASPFLGICALSGVIIINLLALLLGCNKDNVRVGLYGFNAVLLGLILGYEYKFNLTFIVIFVISIALLFLFTIFFEVALNKKGLPFLTLPFLLAYWIVYLSLGSLEGVNYQDQMIYIDNFYAKESSSVLFQVAHCMDNIALPEFINVFLRTLSATFFQNSVFLGLLLSLGLIYVSRISFTVTLLGFASAFCWFKVLGVDLTILTEFLQGSNFIFMSIALGCFFVVPNYKSYLTIILLTPILVFFLISCSKLFYVFQLQPLTISFSIFTLLALVFIKNNTSKKYLQLVFIQYYSPEKVLYKTLSNVERSTRFFFCHLQLPVWGIWKVTQGYNGDITHLGDWRHALDFSLVDEDDKTYKNYGSDLSDYYAYNKPVVAPMDGFVYDIVNNVDNNKIGEVNMRNNWGNSIIINHQNGLFSQLSHLQKDSFKVKVGDYVLKNSMIATCGNSGRSPEPHIHYQVQVSPYIGSKTITYPFAYYILYQNGKRGLKICQVPNKNDLISQVDVCSSLYKAFNILPSRVLRLRNKDDANEIIDIIAYTDAYNKTFLQTADKKSTLWYEFDGTTFVTYDFEGQQNSVLFNLYLATHKVLLATYDDIYIEDTFPTIYFSNPIILFFQDLLSPFYQFSHSKYRSIVKRLNNDSFLVNSRVEYVVFGKVMKQKELNILIKDDKLTSFYFYDKKCNKTYICE